MKWFLPNQGLIKTIWYQLVAYIIKWQSYMNLKVNFITDYSHMQERMFGWSRMLVLVYTKQSQRIKRK